MVADADVGSVMRAHMMAGTTDIKAVTMIDTADAPTTGDAAALTTKTATSRGTSMPRTTAACSADRHLRKPTLFRRKAHRRYNMVDQPLLQSLGCRQRLPRHHIRPRPMSPLVNASQSLTNLHKEQTYWHRRWLRSIRSHLRQFPATASQAQPRFFRISL